MAKRILIAIMCQWLALPAFGCDKPSTFLLIGEKAPCNGYLFTEEAELKLRKRFLEFDFLEKELELKNNELDLYKDQNFILSSIAEKEREKSEIWRTAAEKSSLELIKTKQNQGFRDWLFFVGGIACTVAAGYAIGQAAK